MTLMWVCLGIGILALITYEVLVWRGLNKTWAAAEQQQPQCVTCNGWPVSMTSYTLGYYGDVWFHEPMCIKHLIQGQHIVYLEALLLTSHFQYDILTPNSEDEMSGLTRLLDEERYTRSKSVEGRRIVEKIFEGYVGEDEIWRQKSSFAPSGVFYGSGTCAKRWFLSFNGGIFESKADALSIAGMKNGIDSHARIQSAMLKSGVAKEIEVKLTLEDPPIYGYADALDDDTVYEIKTTKHKNFEYRRNTNKIADYHLAQVLLYMYITGLNKGVVIYESKDTNEMHAIPFEMTDDYRALVKSILDWMMNVWAMYKEDVMPARSYRKGSKVCAGCPVEKLCDEKDGKVAMERLNYSL